MFKWLIELKYLFYFEREMRLRRHVPSTIAGMNAAMDKAIRNFPNDPSRETSRAMSEQMIRRAQGLRSYDA